jgi:hypothetical protein
MGKKYIWLNEKIVFNGTIKTYVQQNYCFRCRNLELSAETRGVIKSLSTEKEYHRLTTEIFST